MREAVVSSGDARRRADDEGTEADDESEVISVGGPLSIVGGCESEGVTFEEEVGRAVLVSEMENAFDSAGLRLFSFQASRYSLTFCWVVILTSFSIR